MKRYTTPILPIKIRMPFEDVQSIEFIFKKDLEDNSPVLLHKVYATRKEIPVEQSTVSTEFTVNLALEAEETAKLMPGEVFMDTLIVLTGDYIPTTKIVKLIIDQSLFAGVKVNGSS